MTKKMTKEERVRAAVNFQEVDKIPLGLWPHFTDVDQDYKTLSDRHFQFYQYTDMDFVKLMPFGLYAVEDYGPVIDKPMKPDQWAKIVEPFIKEESDWDKIVPLDPSKGTYGNQILYAKQMLKLMENSGDKAPIVQTIFSPLTTLFKLVGEECLFKTIAEKPVRVHKALETITETTIRFVRLNIEAGVSGFFFASQLANYRFMTDAQYDEYGQRYDMQVMEAFQEKTWLNIVHIHSFTPEQEKSMFARLADYPVNCINWHDRWAGPSLAEARKLTDKCLIGGINEEQYFNKVNFIEVYEHVRQAVELGGTTGFMLGPGCTIYEDTPLENYLAARIAAEKYGSF